MYPAKHEQCINIYILYIVDIFIVYSPGIHLWLHSQRLNLCVLVYIYCICMLFPQGHNETSYTGLWRHTHLSLCWRLFFKSTPRFFSLLIFWTLWLVQLPAQRCAWVQTQNIKAYIHTFNGQIFSKAVETNRTIIYTFRVTLQSDTSTSPWIKWFLRDCITKSELVMFPSITTPLMTRPLLNEVLPLGPIISSRSQLTPPPTPAHPSVEPPLYSQPLGSHFAETLLFCV